MLFDQACGTYYKLQNDSDKPPVVRPSFILGSVDLGINKRGQPRELKYVIDYVIYKCPVRHCMSIALEDWRGRYWTGIKWHEGGTYSLYSLERGGFEEAFACPSATGGDVSIMFEQIENMLHHGNSATGAVHMASPEGLGGWIGQSERGGFMPDREYFDNRARMFYTFDQEWGKGAMNRTLKAARARHSAQIRTRKFKQRRMDPPSGEGE